MKISDPDGFARAIDAIGLEARANAGVEDVRHLRKIEWWGRACTALGYATAWFVPNPIAALLLSQGRTTRWAMIAHHVSHGGYDDVPGIPPQRTSAVFARGWRRVVDWFDWITPEAWDAEHNRMHHSEFVVGATGDEGESNVDWLRRSRLPRVVRAVLIALFAGSWKWTFYAPNTLRVLNEEQRRRQDPSSVNHRVSPASMWRRPELWFRCLLPYAIGQFVLIPALFLLISPWAALFVLINSLMAELITNLHSFSIVATNHVGDDLKTYRDPVRDGKGEAYARQVVGSTNFRTGGDFNDFLHGWLNYQIEHHLYPDISMRQYQRVQPAVRAACERFGVPYVQEPVSVRLRKTIAVMMGDGRPAAHLMPAPTTPSGPA